MPSDAYWLELHTDMPKHPQTLQHARLLKISRREAIGVLADLWTWALPIADRDGRLDGITAADILVALDMQGKKAAAVVPALIQSGYLEQDGEVYVLHNWYFYAGRLNERREKERNKKRRQRERRAAQSPAPVPDVSPGTSPGSPETTEQNKTEPTHVVSYETTKAPGTAPSLSEIEEFCLGQGGTSAAAAEFYSQYSRAGWQANGQPIENWRGLLTNYLRSGGGQGGQGAISTAPQGTTEARKSIERMRQLLEQTGHGGSVPPNARKNAEWMRRMLDAEEAENDE